jgi:hypothetical protein
MPRVDVSNNLRVMPSYAGYAADRACLFNIIGETLRVPPAIILAAWLASLPASTIRHHHLYGLVRFSEIGIVGVHFNVGITINTQEVCAAPPGMPTIPLDYSEVNSALNLYHVGPIASGIVAGQMPPLSSAAFIGATLAQVDLLTRNTQKSIRSLQHYRHALCPVPGSFAIQVTMLNYQDIVPVEAQFPDHTDDRAPAYVPLPRSPLRAATYEHVIDYTAADLLSCDLRDFPAVWSEGNDNLQRAREQRETVKIAKQSRDRTTGTVVTLFGVPGSGKSTLMRNLELDLEDLTWACPSSAVEAHLKLHNDFPPGLPEYNIISGWEVLRKGTQKYLVLDDFTRWPVGIVDLLFLLNDNLEVIYLPGDVTQACPRFNAPNAMSRALPSGPVYANLKWPNFPYGTISHRLADNVAELLGLYKGLPTDYIGSVNITTRTDPNHPIFVVSPRFTETKTAGGFDAITLSLAQGLSLDVPYTLDMSGMTSTISDGLAFMALTRGNSHVNLAWDFEATSSKYQTWGDSPILSSIIAASAASHSAVLHRGHDPQLLVARAVSNHIRRCVPHISPVPPDPLVGFTDTTASSDPGTIARFHGAEQLANPAVAINVRISHAPAISPSLNHNVRDPLHLMHDYRDANCRQRVINPNMSTLTHSLDSGEPRNHHLRSDVALARWTIAERLDIIPGPHTVPTPLERRRAHALIDTFKRVFVPQQTGDVYFNESLLDEAASSLFATKIRKLGFTQSMRGIHQNALDASAYDVSLFIKQQWVRKLEKHDASAFPAQTITAKSTLAALADDAMAAVFQHLLVRMLPPNVHYALDDSDSDVRARLAHIPSGSLFTSIDYTRWDSGVDLGILLYYAWLFRYFRFPSLWITEWLHRSVASKSYLGYTMPHQESGNRFTLIHNTHGNHMVTQATMCVDASHEDYKGDDALIVGTVRPRPGAPPFLAKPRADPAATSASYIGFTVGQGVPHIQPRKLLNSTLFFYTHGASRAQINALDQLFAIAEPSELTATARDIFQSMRSYISSHHKIQNPLHYDREVFSFSQKLPLAPHILHYLPRVLTRDLASFP